MIFLPIVGRELRVAARRRGTYWLRVGVASLAMLIGGWVVLGTWGKPSSEIGQSLFVALAVLVMLGASVAGVLITADCLSEEKRDGTLGLLFLTDLKGYDVVLGKLAATSLNASYSLVAVFPVLALPLLLGGVSITEFWRITLVSLNMLFLSLAIGMIASAVCKDERRAMGMTILVLLVLIFGLPVVLLILNSKGIVHDDQTFFIEFCPAYSGFTGFDLVYKTREPRFWRSTAIVHLLGWLCIFLSSRVVANSWKDKAASARTVRWRECWMQWCHGNSRQRREYRASLLDINPILWLAARNRLKRSFVHAFLAVAAVLWLWGYLVHRDDWLDTVNYIFTAMTLQTLLKPWAITEACRRFSEDRRAGALELLLSTPLRVVDLLEGQWLALRRQFGGAVAVILGVDLILMLATRASTFQADDKAFLTWMFLAGIAVFLADLLGIAWTGMWLGLTSRKANRATFGTFWRVLLLPWVIYAVAVTSFVLLDEVFRFSSAPGMPGSGHGEYWLLGLWVLISVGCTAWFGLRARNRLVHELREVAITRYTIKSGGWWPFRKREVDGTTNS